MTRKTILSVLVALACAGCAREESPASQARPGGASPAPPSPASGTARPIVVFVSVEGKGASPLAQDWVRELNSQFASQPEQFKTAAAREEAEATVSIESAVATPNTEDHAVLSGKIVMGQRAVPFRLDYTGSPAVMAPRFAKYLVGQVEASRAGAPKASPAS